MCVETRVGFHLCIVFVIGDSFGDYRGFVMCHRQTDKLSGRFYVLFAGKRARWKVECVAKGLPKVEHQTSNIV
jgi:hypothetical protein